MRTIFISSTYKDLADHRRAVVEAINSLDGFKCVCMEQFGARDSTPADFCVKSIEQCDLFVGILGHMYGSIDPAVNKSFTELEFDTARRLRKHRLIFFSREDASVPIQLVESDDLRSRQSKYFNNRLD